MTQSSVPMMPTPNPMKKKVIAALIAVVIGHTGVMWGLSHMKTPELRPIEKEPLKVRFVKIKEPPKPDTPKPEPKKEKPKPAEVKKVKIVDKPKPAASKKVDKIQQVKKADTPKVNTPVESTINTKLTAPTSTNKTPEPVKSTPADKPTQTEKPANPAPKGPVDLGGKGGVKWSLSPKPNAEKLKQQNKDLAGQVFSATFRISGDAKGKVTRAALIKSSGNSAVDKEIERAILGAKFKPYKEGGVAYAIVADQPFTIKL